MASAPRPNAGFVGNVFHYFFELCKIAAVFHNVELQACRAARYQRAVDRLKPCGLCIRNRAHCKNKAQPDYAGCVRRFKIIQSGACEQ